MNAPGRPPPVSLGMPVYNGEQFIARALHSLLEQTLSDFELIISDNASTDTTPAICAEFARMDARIRYLRQPHNIGAPRNWNVLVHEATGEYFKWCPSNDHWDREMLQKCVAELQRDREAVLCYGRTELIDEKDAPICVFDGDHEIANARPSERFFEAARRIWMNNAQCAVIRTEALRHTRLDRLYPSGDLALMAELSLYGSFRLLPDVLTYRRQGPKTFSSLRTPLELQRLYDPGATKPMRLLRVRRHLDHFLSIARAPVSTTEKMRTWRLAGRLAAWDRAHMWREFCTLLPHAAS
ncbi:MAG TPA: glycosyltransferase [Burkholderiaceae bacterium]|nr:glycosyltransferase [Burkholderiaceae bacterium]